MDVFNIKSIAGQYSAIDSYSNDKRIKVVNFLLDELYDYFDYLISLGYKKQCENNFNNNLSAQFNNDKYSVFIFYSSFNHTLLVTQTEKCQIIFNNQTNNTIENLSIMQMPVQGMGYAIQLLDGTFILIDGGEYTPSDCQYLYEYLRSNTPSDKDIIITAWFLSHPHMDHIGLATEFIKEYHDKIIVKSFIYNFPNMDFIDLYMEDKSKTAFDIYNLENAISNYCNDSVIYPIYTGQEFNFAGVSVKVLFTVDNFYPSKNFYSLNDLSVALKFDFINGKSVLFLTDCMSTACDMLNKTYKDYLKCDILQVAHHGLFGGDLDLYKNVNPDICLWPVKAIRFNGKADDKYQWCLGEGGLDFNSYLRDDKIKKRRHIHNGNFEKIII